MTLRNIKIERQVNHAAESMLELVADIARYQEFLPLCTTSHVLTRNDRDHLSMLNADLSVGLTGIGQTFNSDVIVDRRAMRIQSTATQKPFRYMHSQWQFTPISDQECKIVFEMVYEFRSRALGGLVGSMFERVQHQTLQAFVKRADQMSMKGK